MKTPMAFHYEIASKFPDKLDRTNYADVTEYLVSRLYAEAFLRNQGWAEYSSNQWDHTVFKNLRGFSTKEAFTRTINAVISANAE